MTTSSLKPSEEMIWQKYQSEEAKNIDFPKMSVLDLIKEENRGSRLDNTALNYYDNKISYGQFFDNVNETIESLKSNTIFLSSDSILSFLSEFSNCIL